MTTAHIHTTSYQITFCSMTLPNASNSVFSHFPALKSTCKSRAFKPRQTWLQQFRHHNSFPLNFTWFFNATSLSGAASTRVKAGRRCYVVRKRTATVTANKSALIRHEGLTFRSCVVQQNLDLKQQQQSATTEVRSTQTTTGVALPRARNTTC